MHELRLLLNFSETPGNVDRVEELRALLLDAIVAFAEQHEFKILAPPGPDTFNSTASNKTLTHGWKSKNWPVEVPNEVDE